tara:strand:+ start:309 stop:656 length:348 start_codon:yes stop_codon:yes gene_type:complete
MKVTKQFPDFDNIDLFNTVLEKVKSMGFKDSSYENDDTPSLTWFFNGEPMIVLWIMPKGKPLRHLADQIGLNQIRTKTNYVLCQVNPLEYRDFDGYDLQEIHVVVEAVRDRLWMV